MGAIGQSLQASTTNLLNDINQMLKIALITQNFIDHSASLNEPLSLWDTLKTNFQGELKS